MQPFGAKAAEVLAELEEAGEVAGCERRRVGRYHAEDRLHRLRHEVHQAAVLIVRLRIARRMAIQLAPSLVVIGPGGKVVAVFHRCDGALERQDVQPMPRQIEVADDLRPQQADDVGKRRELEAGEDLFGDGCTADTGPAFEHEDRFPGAREISRRHQAVMASTDDDDVVFLHARLRSGLKKGRGVRNAFACLRRCSTVISIRTSVPALCSEPRWANAM